MDYICSLVFFFLKAASLQMTCFYPPPHFCHTDSHTPLVHSYTHVHAHTHIYHTYSYTLSVTYTHARTLFSFCLLQTHTRIQIGIYHIHSHVSMMHIPLTPSLLYAHTYKHISIIPNHNIQTHLYGKHTLADSYTDTYAHTHTFLHSCRRESRENFPTHPTFPPNRNSGVQTLKYLFCKMAMVDHFSSSLRTQSLIEAFTYIDIRTNTRIYVHTFTCA